MSESTFLEWMEHEFPDLFAVPDLHLDMWDTDSLIMRRRLSRTTWDSVWHEIHRRMKPGNVVTIAVSQGGGK